MKAVPSENVGEFSNYRQSHGVVTGRIIKSNHGNVFVDFTGNPNGPVKARVTSSAKKQIANLNENEFPEVLLAFENDNINNPIIIDTLFSYIDELAEQASVEINEKPEDIKVDGKKVVIEGKDEIVLSCGDSKIIMKKNKIIIHSENIKTHATKTNKIKGGLIKIN